MKNFQQLVLAITISILLAACTSSPTINQLLANKETRSAIIDTIANDDKMSVEMMQAMMNNKDSMHRHMGAMMEMMRENPGMMNTVMSNLMEASNKDSNMMTRMYENMMNNKDMMERMKQRMTKKKDTSSMR